MQDSVADHVQTGPLLHASAVVPIAVIHAEPPDVQAGKVCDDSGGNCRTEADAGDFVGNIRYDKIIGVCNEAVALGFENSTVTKVAMTRLLDEYDLGKLPLDQVRFLWRPLERALALRCIDVHSNTHLLDDLHRRRAASKQVHAQVQLQGDVC